AGIGRDEIFITNAVKFRPTNVRDGRVSNRTPGRAEWRAGLPLLRAEIEMIRPPLIATLGNTPLCALMCLAKQDTCVGIGERHGRAYDVQIEGRSYTLFPLYHPASVIYNPALSDVLREDLCRLGALLREKEGIACDES
ncbi:MAG: uracil-DNA glycosylase, partial [Eubacteriales bacterium]|nr:uracil-DNA glycosylase [Eubacteriales bacterium]